MVLQELAEHQERVEQTVLQVHLALQELAEQMEHQELAE